MPGRARSVGTNTALYADDSLVTLTASVTVEIPTAGSLPIDWAVKVRAKAGASTLVGPLGKLALAVGQTANVFASDGEVVADLGGTTTVLARTGSTAEEGLDQLLSLQAAVDARLGRLHRTRALHDQVPPQNRAVRQSSPASAKPRSWINLIRSSDRWERASSRSACHANSHGRPIYYKCSKFIATPPCLGRPACPGTARPIGGHPLRCRRTNLAALALRFLSYCPLGASPATGPRLGRPCCPSRTAGRYHRSPAGADRQVRKPQARTRPNWNDFIRRCLFPVSSLRQD